MALSEKQRRFVEEYLVDLNATAAARRAGYSEKTCRSIGAENLTKPDIQAAIAEAMSKRAEQCDLSAEKVVRGLLDEAERFGEGSSHSARVRAWELLGKHLGMFTDRVEHSSTGGPLVILGVSRRDVYGEFDGSGEG